MKTIDFEYYLPEELIAQTPVEPRDQSRLMVVSRSDSSLRNHKFFELVDYLQAGDVLVFNSSRVIPARLSGNRVDTGEVVDILLLRQLTRNVWETVVKCDRRLDIGARIEIAKCSITDDRQDFRVLAEVIEIRQGGKRVISFPDKVIPLELGKVPLPSYIRAPLTNPERYQTVYAEVAGSVAAPTAGLHFTSGLIDRIRDKGVQCLFVTLHIGLDTFRPVRVADIERHPVHQEYGILSQEVATQLSQARMEGRRIICVGTTTVRLLEAVAQVSDSIHLQPFEGWVSLFILPGYQFKIVDAIITNFHLPRSTLLMLVSAFAGRELINQAYSEAVTQKYRFYSFGDAMLII